MMDEIRRVKKSLRLVNEVLESLSANIGLIPVEVENKTLMGYFGKIMEEKAEFTMALDRLEQKYKPAVKELSEEEKLADDVRAEKINIFTAADKANNKQKFWKAMRKLAGEV